MTIEQERLSRTYAESDGQIGVTGWWWIKVLVYALQGGVALQDLQSGVSVLARQATEMCKWELAQRQDRNNYSSSELVLGSNSLNSGGASRAQKEINRASRRRPPK